MDEHRILLVLYCFEECTYQEAAEILRIPEGTVKSRVNSAKKALKREVEAAERERDGD
ncbi:hypothetical protein WJ0W_002330 [Paenibacillus melissococcoides]|uniref:RNA polymerase sigma factor 70 region 4 type 2 domain-containing protein n=1 Tax=Paenibacillus melissococcoides TaxID=2912268 RepID=A0ABM9G0J8_9BACL|nr:MULTISPECIES: sigma factor-like helix-turn-helix DNA-binding protein [Paenibacillus]MEB9892384.1 sigma factor-like helix-turn-helix DNA-binding protein [Bacillus cereus]CAH8245100.1 hypothetical protein WJ0W_002330 [Paenibacillus melissococcoides]CAH8709901.1 hypothetical protein WDD9_002409 [Paenibacillus melissococcoides]CAH8710628.1 hypothetical protein HTL2_002696 [Paenibacillus melissococcoides]GIO81669.1 hypothetical protein J6TS7_52790 [Paenibacillus dendritiformis]